MRNRIFTIATVISMALLTACAGPEPVPEPGLEVLRHARNEEMQVAPGVDWSSYTKVILHTAPVEFRDHWKQDQERNYGVTLRDEELERFKTSVSDQYAKVVVKRLSEGDAYELTKEAGPGVMHFIPRIADLDIRGPGMIQSSILESVVNSKGSATFEMVIRDSVSDELLAVAWQEQSDPDEGYLEPTNTVNNTVAFRLMIQRSTDWLIKQLEKAEAQQTGP